MITVEKEEGLSLKITHVMPATKKQQLELYLFIPGGIEFSTKVISETDFYHTSMTEKRFYYSQKNRLPLVHSRLAQRGKLSNAQYRVSLSLFAYQYAMALDDALAHFRRQEFQEAEDLIAQINETVYLSLDILKQLRRKTPSDETQQRYYNNIDNYLSWYTEQKFLAFIDQIPRKKEFTQLKHTLMDICENENSHRADMRYNSLKALGDVTRMSNKMLLLRRLIEYPIVLRSKLTSLGAHVLRVIKGLTAGFVMILVTSVAVVARDYLGEITASFVVAMSIIYALRDIFKDDMKEVLWRWVRRGKPKWRRRYFDPSTSKEVGVKLEWLDYLNYKQLPVAIREIRKHRVTQREEKVVLYRSQTQMVTTSFTGGYEETCEVLNLHLGHIARLLIKESTRVFQLHDRQVSKVSIERQHLLNLIIKEDNYTGTPNFYRWKVVINRSQIVDIEQIPL